MRTLIAATLAVVMVATPAAALAQGAAASAGQHPAQPAPAQLRPPADLPSPEDLGLSIKRIRRELRETPPTQSALLRYDFHVEVFGTNPKVDFFKDFDLSPNGAVRYGGMTHSEFLNVVTPQAFRAPSADLAGLALMAIEQLAKRKANSNKDRNQ